MTLAEQAEQRADELDSMTQNGVQSATSWLLRQCAAALREREGAQQAGQVPQYRKGCDECAAHDQQRRADNDWHASLQRGRELLSAAPEAPAQPAPPEDRKVYKSIADRYFRDTQPEQGEREAFERATRKEHPDFPMDCTIHADGEVIYNSAGTQHRWRAWQARAALSAAPQRKPMPKPMEVIDVGKRSLQLIFDTREEADEFKRGITGEGT